LGAWLAKGGAPRVRELLNPDAIRRRGLFRPEEVTALLRDQDRGRRTRSLHMCALVVLKLWFRLRVEDLPLG